jgi:hypothetical protein
LREEREGFLNGRRSIVFKRGRGHPITSLPGLVGSPATRARA